MTELLAYLGLALGVASLIVMALRGFNILLAVLIASLIVALSNQLGVARTLLEYFPAGPLGAFTFAGQFFVLFLSGAIFGKVMATGGAAAAIAQMVIARLGSRRVLLVTILVSALLTYGGVVLFVVIFTMYPLGIALMREANLPKRLFCGALALGAGTFTMTALPGTPSVQNVIAASALGTDLFAGALLGLAAGLTMFLLGWWYLERQWQRARAAGEGFVSNSQDAAMEALAPKSDTLPRGSLATLPPLIVLATILLPRLILWFSADGEALVTSWGLLQFATGQPILWPSLALLMGTSACVLVFPRLRQSLAVTLGEGANDSIMPLLNTAAVIGFGGVVTQTAGFAAFAHWVVSLELPPLLSIAVSVSVVSGTVGSASGGLQIFMQTFAETYLAAGVSAEALHRIAAIASGGLDSLPHSGAVIAMLTIMGLRHAEAYRDVFMVTVIVPVVATLLAIGLAGWMY